MPVTLLFFPSFFCVGGTTIIYAEQTVSLTAPMAFGHKFLFISVPVVYGQFMHVVTSIGSEDRPRELIISYSSAAQQRFVLQFWAHSAFGALLFE